MLVLESKITYDFVLLIRDVGGTMFFLFWVGGSFFKNYAARDLKTQLLSDVYSPQEKFTFFSGLCCTSRKSNYHVALTKLRRDFDAVELITKFGIKYEPIITDEYKA